jgi:hypothetical protein
MWGESRSAAVASTPDGTGSDADDESAAAVALTQAYAARRSCGGKPDGDNRRRSS